MAGFKDEKEMWQYQSKKFVGKWDRYELFMPSGHPDVKGSYLKDIYYVENKVGTPSYNSLEESQKEYLNWLVECHQRVYICWGSATEKSLRFTLLHHDFLLFPIVTFVVPPFFTGKVTR